MNLVSGGSTMALLVLVSLVGQFAVQVAATLVALFIWDRVRGRHAR